MKPSGTEADDPLEPSSEPAPEQAGANSGASLDKALVRGLAWTGIARWTAQLATWMATIVVARLLATRDFGIWTSAGVYLGVITLLTEFGIGASIVMLRDLDDSQIAQINSFSVLAGVAGTAFSLLMASPTAWFYRTPEIAAVVSVMSVLFLVSAFRIVPLALLQKELKFKWLAFVDAARSVFQAAVLVGAAAAGMRYWTLVIGAVAGETAWTAMILAYRRHPFSRPRLDSIRRAVSFSTDVVVARVAWYVYSNADFLVAGRRLGQAAQGAYGLAWNLASVPVEKISSIVVGVTPAFFSAVQTNAAELRRYLLALTQGISLLAFPAAVGLALVADTFVYAVLGARWAPAILPLRILALYTTVRAIGPVLTPILNAIGETRFAAFNNLLALAILPTAFLIGSNWGTAGVAAGWLVGHPIIVALLLRRVAVRIELRMSEYAMALWPALSSTIAMSVVVLGVKHLVTPDLPELVALVLEATSGACAYVALLFGLHGRQVRKFRRILAEARRQ